MNGIFELPYMTFTGLIIRNNNKKKKKQLFEDKKFNDRFNKKM